MFQDLAQNRRFGRFWPYFRPDPQHCHFFSEIVKKLYQKISKKHYILLYVNLCALLLNVLCPFQLPRFTVYRRLKGPYLKIEENYQI